MKKILNLSVETSSQINFAKEKFDAVIIGNFEAKTLSKSLKELDSLSGGIIKK